jgi:hypothetical protein
MIFISATTAVNAPPNRPSDSSHVPFAGAPARGTVSDEFEANKNHLFDGRLFGVRPVK